MGYLMNNWLAAVLISMGFFVFIIGWRSNQHAMECVNWPSTTGVVTSSSIITKHRTRNRKMHGRKRTVHLPKVEFSYQVSGTRLLHIQTHFWKQSAGQIVRKFPAGATVTVFYNPKDLNDSYVELPRGANNVAVFLSGGVLIFTGLVLFALPFLENRARSKPQKSDAI